LNNSNHHITGQALLALTRDQLQQAPFLMVNMHEVDHLQSCIETLRKQQLTNYMKKVTLSELKRPINWMDHLY